MPYKKKTTYGCIEKKKSNTKWIFGTVQNFFRYFLRLPKTANYVHLLVAPIHYIFCEYLLFTYLLMQRQRNVYLSKMFQLLTIYYLMLLCFLSVMRSFHSASSSLCPQDQGRVSRTPERTWETVVASGSDVANCASTTPRSQTNTKRADDSLPEFIGAAEPHCPTLFRIQAS